MKKIISLHDFEKIDLLGEIAERQLFVQDKESLRVIASRFRNILGEVVNETLELKNNK